MKVTSFAAAAVVLLGSLAPGNGAVAQEALRLGTSTSGSVFYTLAVGLGRVVQEEAGINTTVEPVGGSHANIFAIMNDQVDLAIVNSLAAIDGLRGREPFPQPVGVRLVAQGHVSLRQVLVRQGSGVEEPADLAGKTLMGIMPPNPDIEQISRVLLETADVDPNSVQLVSMAGSGEAVTALEAGTIDAVTLPASLGAAHVSRLMDNGTIQYLDISDEFIEEMQPSLPEGMFVTKIPAGSYPNLAEDANVFAIRTVLVAAEDAPESEIYAVAKALFENPDEFAQYHAAARQWTLESTLDAPRLPFHPGVVRYLEETGAWSEELEAAQDSLSQ